MSIAMESATAPYMIQLEEIGKDLRNTDQNIDFQANKNLIERILKLRDEKNVLILGHNYMTPLVYNLSPKEQRGDSLALSMHAAKASNPIILFDGVRFMAETAKILNPGKKVLIADMDAGCSLADPFTAKDVIDYKKKYPGSPVVTYINSYAEVKAESDYCCTSANALAVIKHAAKKFNTKKIIFFPDSLMGANLQNDLRKEGNIELIYPGLHDKKYGRCEVHEQIKASDIRTIRKQYNMIKGSADSAVIVHPECHPDVVAEADFSGSTSAMGIYIKNHPQLKKVYLGTECEMSANLAGEFPAVEFIKTCQVHCQHMRRITLEKILHSLENLVYEVNVPEDIAKKAIIPIERMLAIGRDD